MGSKSVSSSIFGMFVSCVHNTGGRGQRVCINDSVD